MELYLPLYQLEVGKRGRVVRIDAKDQTRRRMLDLGIIPGTMIDVLYRSPFKDPTAYHVRGTVIALRQEEAANIWIERVD